MPSCGAFPSHWTSNVSKFQMDDHDLVTFSTHGDDWEKLYDLTFAFSPQDWKRAQRLRRSKQRPKTWPGRMGLVGFSPGGVLDCKTPMNYRISYHIDIWYIYMIRYSMIYLTWSLYATLNFPASDLSFWNPPGVPILAGWMVPPVPRSNEATVNSSAAVLTPGAIGAGTPAPGLAPPLTNAQAPVQKVTSNGEWNGVKQGILKKPAVTVVIWFRIFETCGHGDTWWKSRYPLGSGSSGFCMRIEAKWFETWSRVIQALWNHHSITIFLD